jgi:hypothetical protein
VPTFANREFHVVSVTDPYGHILGFLDQKLYINKSKRVKVNLFPKQAAEAYRVVRY